MRSKLKFVIGPAIAPVPEYIYYSELTRWKGKWFIWAKPPSESGAKFADPDTTYYLHIVDGIPTWLESNFRIVGGEKIPSGYYDSEEAAKVALAQWETAISKQAAE